MSLDTSTTSTKDESQETELFIPLDDGNHGNDEEEELLYEGDVAEPEEAANDKTEDEAANDKTEDEAAKEEMNDSTTIEATNADKMEATNDTEEKEEASEAKETEKDDSEEKEAAKDEAKDDDFIVQLHDLSSTEITEFDKKQNVTARYQPSIHTSCHGNCCVGLGGGFYLSTGSRLRVCAAPCVCVCVCVLVLALFSLQCGQ